MGIRPENLIPSSRASGEGSGLRGRVGVLEYHGYQWMAQLDVGFRPVEAELAGTRLGREGPPADGHQGEHRRARLLVRLDSPGGWRRGQEVSVTVDVPRIQVFAADGRRIGPWQTMELSTR